MTEELKKGPELKAFKAKTNIKTTDGYNETWDIASNVPGAKKPATPLESIVTTVGAMSRYAAMYANAGGAAIAQAIESAGMAWKWKSGHGYEAGDDPRLDTLKLLANDLGYLMVPHPAGRGVGHLDEAMKRDAEETREAADHVATWERRWKGICTNENGTLDLDAIQRELADYALMMGFYSRVLEHVTGGRISKELTWPSVICAVADDRLNEIIADETKDLQDQIDNSVPKGPWKRDDESLYDALLLVDHDVPIGVMPYWTDEQAKQAEEWAIAAHYRASDNNDIEVPPYPEFLAPYKTEPASYL